MKSFFLLLLNGTLLGLGLAMDAFSVALANGMNEPAMSKKKMILTSSVFCFFQFAMPMAGWICVHLVAEAFEGFQKFIPWIALALLLYIGIGMIRESKKAPGDGDNTSAGIGSLIVQGIATSIDALSVGFTIASYGPAEALTESAIIGVVTFVICIFGVILGKKFGTRLAGKASVFGGIILIAIGIEIFVTGVWDLPGLF